MIYQTSNFGRTTKLFIFIYESFQIIQPDSSAKIYTKNQDIIDRIKKDGKYLIKVMITF